MSLLALSRRAWMVALMLGALASSASAQTLNQSMEILGWTSTGSELVVRTTVDAEGMSDKGDPLNWRYSLLEVYNARTGSLITRYRAGEPSGARQKAWDEAKPIEEGLRFSERMGIVPSVKSPVAPGGGRVLTALHTQQEAPMEKLEAQCLGCSLCTSNLQMYWVEREKREVYTLPLLQRTGQPYPPDQGDKDCPALSTEVHWSPNGERAVVVLSERHPSSGSVLQSLRVYDLQDNAAIAWPKTAVTRSQGSQRVGQLQKVIDGARERIGQTEDPLLKSQLLSQIGDLAMRQGNTESARASYATALEFDKNNGDAHAGLATASWLVGDLKTAKTAIKQAEKLDKRDKLYGVSIGIFYLISGDDKRAQSFLQEAVNAQGGASFTDRLLLGLRLLDTDLSAGLAYMANLFEGVEGQDVPQDLLQSAALRLAEESLAQRDYEGTGRYLALLDKAAPETQRLGLRLGALRGDPQRIEQVAQAALVLLERDPGQCDIYLTRGLAFSRLAKPKDAFSNLAAAVACDPDLAEARYYVADLYRFAGKLDDAKVNYARYLELEPERRGDAARKLRRNHVERLLPRLSHQGLILVSADCTTSDGGALRCKGVARNTSQASSGPADIVLRAQDTQSKKPAPALETRAQLPTVAPGASLDFAITLEGADPAMKVELSLGRDDAERELNRTSIR